MRDNQIPEHDNLASRRFFDDFSKVDWILGGASAVAPSNCKRLSWQFVEGDHQRFHG